MLTSSQLHDNQRKQARELWFDWMLMRDGHLCRYCGVTVMRLKDCGRRIVSQTAHHVKWIDKHGTYREDPIATIDHVVPLADGGENRIENCVTCCAACNSYRNKLAHGAPDNSRPCAGGCGRKVTVSNHNGWRHMHTPVFVTGGDSSVKRPYCSLCGPVFFSVWDTAMELSSRLFYYLTHPEESLA